MKVVDISTQRDRIGSNVFSVSKLIIDIPRRIENDHGR